MSDEDESSEIGEGQVIVDWDERWRLRLPIPLRVALFDGVERIKRVRDEIREASPVRWMPSVRVRGVVWLAPDRRGGPSGMRGFIQVGDAAEICAVIPAQTVVCDEGYQRKLLVHEFSHCFDFLRRAVAMQDSGSGTLALPVWADPSDERVDREQLADPHDWFGPRDVEEFIFWTDGDITKRAIEQHQLMRYLDVESPDRSVSLRATLRFPDVVLAKALELRGRPYGYGLEQLTPLSSTPRPISEPPKG